MVKVNRTTLQNLAEIRHDEAKILLDNEMYDGAYYLSGYVIELALKACIAKQTKEWDFPDKNRVSDNYTHDLTKLFRNSSLWTEFTKEFYTNTPLKKNWAYIKDWSEISRYKTHSKTNALDLFNAVTDINSGVFEWIKHHW